LIENLFLGGKSSRDAIAGIVLKSQAQAHKLSFIMGEAHS
jgi:hypothetical protein